MLIQNILTPRLLLVPFDIPMLQAILLGGDAFLDLTSWTLPTPFSEFPESIPYLINSLTTTPPMYPWMSYAIIQKALQMYIGQCGFKSIPSEDGSIEIGYEIAHGYQANGYADEAIKHLITVAFADRHIENIIAHTLAEKNPSNHLLVKNGFVFDRAIHDPEDGDIWRWSLSRPAYMLKSLLSQ